MQATAQYIEELSEQLSQLASQCDMHDLAYLLRMASEEARTAVDNPPVKAPSAPRGSFG